MFFLRHPSDARVREHLASIADAPFTHHFEGRTRHPIERPPDRMQLDAYGCELGTGDAVYRRGVEALKSFANYPSSFTRVVRLSPGFAVGTVFGTVASHFGFASMQPCRIAFLIDEPDEGRFGFVLGTLPGHVVSGEETFVVCSDSATGRVRYEVRVLSRPEALLARVGRSVVRLVQRRFRRETCAAMRAHCRV